MYSQMLNQPIVYFQIPEAPHLQMFRCEAMRATLSVSACTANWRTAHQVDGPAPRVRDGVLEPKALAGERLFKCKTCPIGARHAGDANASLSALKGALICGRCHRGTMRLVEQHLCVSCWNREREAVLGKNAKGAKPVKLSEVHPRALRVIEGGQPRLIKRQRTAHIEELYVMALRDCHSKVVFAWDPHRPALFAQGRLW